MSIAEAYAQFCASLDYDDLPDEVIEAAKQLILDTVGVAVGGVRAESTNAFFAGVSTRNGSAEGATVLSTGEQMGVEYAALLNGAIAHSLDYDDTHREASLHPGAPVIPAAIAVAEEVGATGKELLTAIVCGYEITCRMGMAVNPASHYDRGFHMTSTCGLFGATAAAGVLYGFDEPEFVSAFGLNGSQASGSLQFLENGGWNKRAHPGLAGHSALLSTSFAQNEFVAATEPFEGRNGFLQGYSDDPDPEKATADLGKRYEICNVAIKPYPCCRYMHAPLDVLFGLVKDEQISSEDVEHVDVRMAKAGIGIVGNSANRYPESFVDCQFSMPFGVALSLVSQDESVDSFFDAFEGGFDDEMKRIMDTTTVSEAEWIEEAYPEQWPAEVIIETTEGTYSRRAEYATGEPEKPLTWTEITEKYEELAEPVIGEAQAAAAQEAIVSLESKSAADVVEPFIRAGKRENVVRN